MAFVTINPRFEDLLRQHDLTTPERLLALPGVIISGHPDRNVARVRVGPIAAFLKREHRVRWRERLANAWAGFGYTSRSAREAVTLQAVHEAGIGCPEWIAFGEDGKGRAFLLIEEIADAVDVQQFLRGLLPGRHTVRRQLARNLGRMLARMHVAGFDHPDIYAKHVLLDRRGKDVYLLDWQRSRRRRHVPWKDRLRDLAALDATLGHELASEADRLASLRSYLNVLMAAPANAVQETARLVRRLSQRLLRKRHVQEARRGPPSFDSGGILWLDGEALCVTEDYWTDSAGRVPHWLDLSHGSDESEKKARATPVPLPDGRSGLLEYRHRNHPLRWLWSELCGRPLMTEEVRKAGALFRQQRYGFAGRRLLAFGQRRARPWQTESFLLTESVQPGNGRGQ